MALVTRRVHSGRAAVQMYLLSQCSSTEVKSCKLSAPRGSVRDAAHAFLMHWLHTIHCKHNANHREPTLHLLHKESIIVSTLACTDNLRVTAALSSIEPVNSNNRCRYVYIRMCMRDTVTYVQNSSKHHTYICTYVRTYMYM